MGRRGRHAFLDHWHPRELTLAGGDTLRWTLMADPARPPTAECFRITSPDGSSRGVHPSEGRALLVEHGHADAAHIRTGTHTGTTFTH